MPTDPNMKTSELIRLLTESLETNGDIEVLTETTAYMSPPDLAVITKGRKKALLLNS